MTTIYEPDTYYRFSPFAQKWVATSGIMNHCEENRCYWVLDTLASYVPELANKPNVDYFLIVQVEVNPDKTGVFTIQQEMQNQDDETGYITLFRQELDYTDLKESWKFWAINESAGDYDPACQTVVLLPEEY
jgi:hypothetical protein